MYKVIIDGVEEGNSDSFGDAWNFAMCFKVPGTKVEIIDSTGVVHGSWIRQVETVGGRKR